MPSGLKEAVAFNVRKDNVKAFGRNGKRSDQEADVAHPRRKQISSFTEIYRNGIGLCVLIRAQGIIQKVVCRIIGYRSGKSRIIVRTQNHAFQHRSAIQIDDIVRYRQAGDCTNRPE